jgi:rhodanese-related sulfurtransferase
MHDTLVHKAVSVEEAHRITKSDSNVVLLDVRTPQEYEGDSGHLANAVLIPVHELERRVDELSQYKDRTIIAYCRTGSRSGRAATLLIRRGFNAVNMEGGIVRWNELKLPVVKGRVR